MFAAKLSAARWASALSNKRLHGNAMPCCHPPRPMVPTTQPVVDCCLHHNTAFAARCAGFHLVVLRSTCQTQLDFPFSMCTSCLTLLVATACNAHAAGERREPREQLSPGRTEDQSLERTIRIQEHERSLNVSNVPWEHDPHTKRCLSPSLHPNGRSLAAR